jgi:ABC-type phosphate/phosphonate transport system substrate-binding protein
MSSGALALVPWADAGSADPNAPSVRLGMVVPKADAALLKSPETAAVAEEFGEVFEKETGFAPKTVSAADPEALAEQLATGAVDLGLFRGYEYAWVSPRHDRLRPLVVVVPADGPARACLVVNTGSAARKPDDLTGDCVVIPTGTKPHCRLYLDRLRAGLPVGTCGLAKADGLGRDDVLDAVAAGKAEAALMDAADLAAYARNKPGPGGRLRTLVRSEPFPSAALVYREGGVSSEVANKIRAGLLRTNTTPGGKALLRIRRLKGFEEPPADYADELEKFRKVCPPPAREK